MTTFDQILARMTNVLKSYTETIKHIQPLVINRDLNGRVRLIVSDQVRSDVKTMQHLDEIAQKVSHTLGPHGFSADRSILFEEDIEEALSGVPSFPLEEISGARVVDRLATDSRWASIAPVSPKAHRVVFFSIKGGVGRSTAIAASAWALGQAGKRVLVLDLDLESPGLSSALLPPDRQPMYGITDWLVEDLVDNGDAVFNDMVASSELSHDGEIYIVPAHGRSPGEYISKLGRAWMPKLTDNGRRESWSERLGRLIDKLELRLQPDVILIDSRSGIDEIASSCVTDLGAGLVLFFAIDGEQTWTGYRILFEYWHQAGVARKIRERLQMVGAMIPETEAADYFAGLREKSWDLFSEMLYDELPPVAPEAIGPDSSHDAWRVDTVSEGWNFEEFDEGAPHYPWMIRWHRGFAALNSLHARLRSIDSAEVSAIFGALVRGLELTTPSSGESND